MGQEDLKKIRNGSTKNLGGMFFNGRSRKEKAGTLEGKERGTHGMKKRKADRFHGDAPAKNDS